MPDVIQRWLQYMSTFDVEIVYRPGKEHGNADGMSRPPIPEENCGARGCVCEKAGGSMKACMDLQEDDGEPDYEECPGTEAAPTTIIAMILRSGKNIDTPRATMQRPSTTPTWMSVRGCE